MSNIHSLDQNTISDIHGKVDEAIAKGHDAALLITWKKGLSNEGDFVFRSSVHGTDDSHTQEAEMLWVLEKVRQAITLPELLQMAAQAGYLDDLE